MSTSNNDERPASTVIEVNKPNIELFARAVKTLYKHVKIKQPELLK